MSAKMEFEASTILPIICLIEWDSPKCKDQAFELPIPKFAPNFDIFNESNNEILQKTNIKKEKNRKHHHRHHTNSTKNLKQSLKKLKNKEVYDDNTTDEEKISQFYDSNLFDFDYDSSKVISKVDNGVSAL